MYYTDTVTIPNYICDQYDHISLWGLARLFQESAGHHAETAGMGFRQLIDRGKAWVLSRMYYVIDRMPKEGETVTVRTWSRGTDGLFAFRDFQLIDSQGVAATCCSYWSSSISTLVVPYEYVTIGLPSPHIPTAPPTATSSTVFASPRTPKRTLWLSSPSSLPCSTIPSTSTMPSTSSG